MKEVSLEEAGLLFDLGVPVFDKGPKEEDWWPYIWRRPGTTNGDHRFKWAVKEETDID